MMKFMPHQAKICQFLWARKGIAGVFAAPGTGKTLPVERYAKHFPPVLLILRRDDFLTWETHLLDELYSLTDYHCIRKGKSPLILKPWVMVTYDLLKNKKIQKWIAAQPWGIVVADESQMIKEHRTARTKRVIKYTRKIPKRIAMTGSPITNELVDVYSQCLFIDGGRTFGTSRWWFLKRYYTQVDYGGWVPKSTSQDQIAKKLSGISYYIHEDDCLQLPPVRSFMKCAEMSTQQHKYYKQILDEWETDIHGVKIELNYIISQLNKLRQVASGFIYDEDGKTHWFSANKLKLLKSLIEDKAYLAPKKKFVVWTAWIAEIEKISEMFKQMGINHTLYYGKMKPQDKVQSRQRFRDDPNCRAFVSQCDCGVGMNELVVADTSVYFSNSYKVISRQQNMRRTRRKGSERHKSITYIDLISEDSVDLKIYQALMKNLDFAQYILNKIRGGYKTQQILSKEFTL